MVLETVDRVLATVPLRVLVVRRGKARLAMARLRLARLGLARANVAAMGLVTVS
jgi:hypothetical protein